jgi:hypothetical protein
MKHPTRKRPPKARNFRVSAYDGPSIYCQDFEHSVICHLFTADLSWNDRAFWCCSYEYDGRFGSLIKVQRYLCTDHAGEFAERHELVFPPTTLQVLCQSSNSNCRQAKT